VFAMRSRSSLSRSAKSISSQICPHMPLCSLNIRGIKYIKTKNDVTEADNFLLNKAPAFQAIP